MGIASGGRVEEALVNGLERGHVQVPSEAGRGGTVCAGPPAMWLAVAHAVRWSRRGQKTVVQSFLMLVTVHLSALARLSACSAPVV